MIFISVNAAEKVKIHEFVEYHVSRIECMDRLEKKEIDLRYTIVFVLGTAVFNLWMGTGQNWTGILPGGLLWFLSRRKRESIGNGDGAVVMGLGWAIGLEKIWSVLMGGFSSPGVWE